MRPRTLAPRRIDDANRGESHRQPDQGTTNIGVGDSLLHWGPRIFDQGDEGSAEIIKVPSPQASIRYSGQWTRNASRIA